MTKNTKEDPSPYEFYFLLLKWRKGAITFDIVLEEGSKWARSFNDDLFTEEETKNSGIQPSEEKTA